MSDVSSKKVGQGHGDALQQRVCRACNTTYKYPVKHSLATRFYCETCADLPAGVRATFEQMNKRIKTLSSAVEKLEKKSGGAAAKPGAPAEGSAG